MVRWCGGEERGGKGSGGMVVMADGETSEHCNIDTHDDITRDEAVFGGMR